MPRRPPHSHGQVALLGDPDDEEDMQWTPENDPDQLAYNAPPDDGEDSSLEEPEGEQDDADETEDIAPSRPVAVGQAVSDLVQSAREKFSQVSTRAMPDGLRRRRVVMALFVQSDGQVKVLR